MRLLILGGTRFVGRHIAEAALAAGWDVTLFTRGRSGSAAAPGAEHRIGDRDGGLEALRDGRWDAVVDTSGYVPRVVRASAELLADRVGAYVFISSVSVYADKSRPGLTEEAPLTEVDDPADEDVEAHYDGLKALCERAVHDVVGERTVVIRPGLIVGPHDPTNRFTYWVTRIAGGGDVLAPEPAGQPVQVIDVGDLAAFVLRLAAGGQAGTYNAVGDVTSMAATLAAITQATGSDARLRWVEEERLIAAGLEPWRDVPLWLAPATDPAHRGFLAVSNERARAAGLELRPLADTVRATLAWARDAGVSADPPAGLDPEVEHRLLAGG